MIKIQNIEEIDPFIQNNATAFFYVSRPNCGVCQAVLPKVEEMLEKYPKIKSAYINVWDVPEVAEKFSVFTVPALLFFVDGKETIRKARFISMDELEHEISRLYYLYYD